MDKDIVPELLEIIDQQFDDRTKESAKLKNAVRALKDKKATYLDANDFAIEVGEILAKVFSDNLTVDVLPDGKMYFNIADRILNQTLKKNYDLVSGYAADVQTVLNEDAGLHLKTQIPDLNQDRIDGMVNKISSHEHFDDIKWMLDEPIVSFSQSIVDDSIEANANFQAKAGLSPKLIRKLSGKACDWCKNLAGTYDYHDAPADIYRRHQRCRCTVEYVPGDGRRQNVHSKEWQEKERKEQAEIRKNIGVETDFQEVDFFGHAKLQDDSDKWYNGLTNEEQGGIYNYTLNKFEYMNQYLRGFEAFSEKDLNEIRNNIDTFSRALSKFVLEEDIVTYRGVSSREYKKILNGNYFKDFKSTSTTKKQALTFAQGQDENYVVKFNIPKGTNGAYLGTNSEYKSESEFTLNKGAKYSYRMTPEGLEVTIIGHD